MVVCYNLWGEPVREVRFWTYRGAERRRQELVRFAAVAGYVSLAERAA